MSIKKPTLKFLSDQERHVISLEYVQKVKNSGNWYIHYLLDLRNNSTKFQLNQLRTQDLQLRTAKHCCDFEI